MSHSILGASGAHRWMNCPGSVRLTKDLPEIKTQYAQEGTAAHALAEVWLRLGSIEGITEIEGVAVTDEMREAVKVYVDYVNTLKEAGTQAVFEQKLTLGRLHPTVPMFGTADTLLMGPGLIEVVDFKYGKGVPVDAIGNVQGLYYILAAMTTFMEGTNIPTTIRFTIIQPRAPHADGSIRSWNIAWEEVKNFRTQLKAAALATSKPDAALVPGSWCRFCSAQGHCPALQKKAQALAQVDFADMPLDRPPEPEALPMEVVTDILGKAGIIEDWFGALRARVQRELEAGREVPGWKLVLKRAVRVWKNVDELMAWAQLTAGLERADLYEDAPLKSPAQVEKLVGKKNLPKELYVSVSSGLTMVPATDKRPAIAAGPQQDFAALAPASTLGEVTVLQSEDE